MVIAQTTTMLDAAQEEETPDVGLHLGIFHPTLVDELPSLA
jgi:hypothetical protein